MVATTVGKVIFAMKMREMSVGLHGIFGMRVYDIRKGKRTCVRRITKNNQITNQGREALLGLMYPDFLDSVNPEIIQEERKIWAISAGTNNTPPTILDDETTMTEVWKHKFSTISAECTIVAIAPNNYHLQISVIMLEGDAVGDTLTEAGIFTRGDDDDPLLTAGRRLYARQTHPAILKSNVMTIEYDWKLGITIRK